MLSSFNAWRKLKQEKTVSHGEKCVKPHQSFTTFIVPVYHSHSKWGLNHSQG